MDECMWTQKTPFGSIVVRAGEQGVRSIMFDNAAKRASAVPPCGRKIARALDEFFAGDAHALDGVSVDLGEVRSEFHRKVLTTLCRAVGPGQTIGYGELAAAAGHPGASRAVGSVMAHNPVPFFIPCHRVIASDGSIGGYGGGLDMKRELLELEGTLMPKERSQRRTAVRSG